MLAILLSVGILTEFYSEAVFTMQLLVKRMQQL